MTILYNYKWCIFLPSKHILPYQLYLGFSFTTTPGSRYPNRSDNETSLLLIQYPYKFIWIFWHGCHLTFLKAKSSKFGLFEMVSRNRMICPSKTCNSWQNSNFETCYFNKFLKKIWPFSSFWGFGLILNCLWPNLGFWIFLDLVTLHSENETLHSDNDTPVYLLFWSTFSSNEKSFWNPEYCTKIIERYTFKILKCKTLKSASLSGNYGKCQQSGRK